MASEEPDTETAMLIAKLRAEDEAERNKSTREEPQWQHVKPGRRPRSCEPKPMVNLKISLSAKSPATKSPATKSPATKSPATKSPTAKSPTAKSPATKSPTAKSPSASLSAPSYASVFATKSPTVPSSPTTKPRTTVPSPTDRVSKVVAWFSTHGFVANEDSRANIHKYLAGMSEQVYQECLDALETITRNALSLDPERIPDMLKHSGLGGLYVAGFLPLVRYCTLQKTDMDENGDICVIDEHKYVDPRYGNYILRMIWRRFHNCKRKTGDTYTFPTPDNGRYTVTVVSDDLKTNITTFQQSHAHLDHSKTLGLRPVHPRKVVVAWHIPLEDGNKATREQ
jgi:hypothetical protein